MDVHVVVATAGGGAPRRVRLVWSGPFSLSEARRLTGSAHRGLYQVYSYHTVFGPRTLVYIGKAVEQPLGVRLAQEGWLRNEREVTVYVARVCPEDYQPGEFADLVDAIERLTINYHTPPYNSAGIASEYTGPPLHVFCWGDRARLLPEYSSHWPQRPADEVW